MLFSSLWWTNSTLLKILSRTFLAKYAPSQSRQHATHRLNIASLLQHAVSLAWLLYHMAWCCAICITVVPYGLVLCHIESESPLHPAPTKVPEGFSLAIPGNIANIIALHLFLHGTAPWVIVLKTLALSPLFYDIYIFTDCFTFVSYASCCGAGSICRQAVRTNVLKQQMYL